MPVYLFSCERCGPFDVWRPVSEVRHPARCPGCGGRGKRIYAPPGIVRTPAAVRTVRELEEKSAHEPEVVAKPRGRSLPSRRHGSHSPPWVLGH